MSVNEMKENLEFYRGKFDSLLDAMKAYESGSEDYTKDDLDEKPDFSEFETADEKKSKIKLYKDSEYFADRYENVYIDYAKEVK